MALQFIRFLSLSLLLFLTNLTQAETNQTTQRARDIARTIDSTRSNASNAASRNGDQSNNSSCSSCISNSDSSSNTNGSDSNGPDSLVIELSFGLTTAITLEPITNLTSTDNEEERDVQTARYVLKAYDQLALEITVGRGEYLNTLSRLVACPEDLKQTFQARLRNDFSVLISQPSYSELNRKEKALSLFLLVKNQANQTIGIS